MFLSKNSIANVAYDNTPYSTVYDIHTITDLEQA